MLKFPWTIGIRSLLDFFNERKVSGNLAFPLVGGGKTGTPSWPLQPVAASVCPALHHEHFVVPRADLTTVNAASSATFFKETSSCVSD